MGISWFNPDFLLDNYRYPPKLALGVSPTSKYAFTEECHEAARPRQPTSRPGWRDPTGSDPTLGSPRSGIRMDLSSLPDGVVTRHSVDLRTKTGKTLSELLKEKK